MQIMSVTAIPLSAPVPEDEQHRTDLGTRVKSDTTIVKIETDTGIQGIGAALGHPPTVSTIIEEQLASTMIGADPFDSERLWAGLYNGSRSEPALERGYSQARSGRRGVTLEAIAGIDIALWDMKGKALDQPIYKLLGGARDSVRAYASGGWAPGDEAEAELGGYVDKGFEAVKMRVVGEDGLSLSNIVERVAAARRGIGPGVDLMVDAHGCLDVPTTRRVAARLEEFDITWFEEPVSPDDPDGLAEVRRGTDMAIAAGEREFTRFDFKTLFDKAAIDIAQPDIARAGGLTECRRIAAMASARNIRVAPHAWGSGVVFAASLQFALATPNCPILEVPQAYMPLRTDLFEEPFEIHDGRVHGPDRPGLGYTLRSDIEDRFEYTPGPQYVY